MDNTNIAIGITAVALIAAGVAYFTMGSGSSTNKCSSATST